MTEGWLVVVALGVATAALKAAGPVALGGRPLPDRIAHAIALLGPAVLAALVATQAFARGQALALDERAIGVGVAAAALALRAPTLFAVVAAAAATALARALG